MPLKSISEYLSSNSTLIRKPGVAPIFTVTAEHCFLSAYRRESHALSIVTGRLLDSPNH